MAGKRIAAGMQALLSARKKRSSDAEGEEEEEPVELIEPHLAKSSILRVMILVAQTQFDHSSHKSSSHIHATNLLNCLASSENNIDREKLEELSFFGITDEIKGLRPLVWRILLNYLPCDASQWDDILRRNREIYGMYLDELIVKPKINLANETEDPEAPQKSQSSTSSVVASACINQQTEDPEQINKMAQENA